MSFDAVIHRAIQIPPEYDEGMNILFTQDDQEVSEHNSSLGKDDLPLTHTENFEFQDIENFQGENTIIRNLDLEGDDYYEEVCLQQVQEMKEMILE